MLCLSRTLPWKCRRGLQNRRRCACGDFVFPLKQRSDPAPIPAVVHRLLGWLCHFVSTGIAASVHVGIRVCGQIGYRFAGALLPMVVLVEFPRASKGMDVLQLHAAVVADFVLVGIGMVSVAAVQPNGYQHDISR